MSSGRVSSLRLTAKNTLLGAIEAIPAERKIVLLDKTTVKIVDSICTLNDILDVGVYLVETVEKKRQPYPTMDAVYFISPEQGSKSSSNVVSADFSDKIPMYKSVHLFYTNEVTQSLFQMLATCPAGPLVKSFQEVFLEFIPFEARAFHLNMPDSFGKLMKSGAEAIPSNIAELEVMASRLVSLIITMNEIPTIKFRSTGGVAPDREGKLAARLANLVQEGLDHYTSRNPNFKPVTGGDLIIVDRTVDLVSPLLHEFTYQAMAHDLLPIHHDNRYDYKFSSGASRESGSRTVALDENDSLWLAMRHTHIADCSKFIVNRFNQFMSENKAAVKQSSKSKGGEAGNVSSMAEMKEAINALGEFQELKSQYSLHFTIAEECLSIFNKKKLVEVAGVEQNMVMGVDPEGKPVKDIWKQMTPLLNRENLSSEDRVRLIMIYLLTQPTLSDADRKSMLDHAKLSSSDMESLRRLMLLCGDSNVMAPKAKKKAEDYTYEVSRYSPRIKGILQDAVAGVLDTSAYSTVKGTGAVNASAPSSAKATPVSLRQKTTAPTSLPNSAGTTSASTPSRSVVLFVIGGITYSEIRSAYEVAEATKREVYIENVPQILSHASYSSLPELEERFQTIEDYIKQNESRFDRLEYKFDSFETRFDNIENLSKLILRKIDSISTQLGQMKQGMGQGMEKLCLEALVLLLEKNGKFSDYPVQSKKFKINNELYEIDVFCLDPPVIIECTTFLRAEELQKIYRFITVKNFLEEKYGCPFECLFISYGIAKELKTEATKLLKENNIKLLSSEKELQ